MRERKKIKRKEFSVLDFSLAQPRRVTPFVFRKDIAWNIPIKIRDGAENKVSNKFFL